VCAQHRARDDGGDDGEGDQILAETSHGRESKPRFLAGPG
jgi:hypothetical protein